jgi:two-component system response regulator CpxR
MTIDDIAVSPSSGTMVSNPMDRILVIDDDVPLTELLDECLRAEGFEVETAHDGERGVAKALAGDYALVVLDVMLPRMSGFEVLMRIRPQSAIPVLMLTARGDPVDRVTGLQMGADDYLPKPFNERELVARIQAVLRRTKAPPRMPATDSPSVLEVADLRLDPLAREVRIKGDLVDLTTVEFDVLRVLLASAGETVTREDLVRDALGRPFSVFDRSLDNHVSSLRRKLGPDAANAERIKTIRGAGYMYAYTTTDSGRRAAR